ncbi:MAG: SCO family protein [Pseudomonadota bacterium]
MRHLAAFCLAAAFAVPAMAESQALPAPTASPFPIKVGGAFELTDQTGAVRTEVDPNGNMQLVFFGYANCDQICSVALPLMADVVDDVGATGVDITPVMITVDPARDTVDAIGPALHEHHPGFVGLTGTPEALAPVYDLFSVEHKLIWEDPEYGPVFAHGSHIYLMDGDGGFLTLIPPILAPERAAEIVATYAEKNS